MEQAGGLETEGVDGVGAFVFAEEAANGAEEFGELGGQHGGEENAQDARVVVAECLGGSVLHEDAQVAAKVEPERAHFLVGEDEDAEEFDDSEFEQDDEESDKEFEERVQEARDEWESEQRSERESRREDHELDWYRQSCPGAQAVPYLREVFDELELNAEEVDAVDACDIGSIEFHDGSCPGNDTYVAATAPDYETLAALQRVLVALKRKCRVVIVEPNPGDAAKA